MGEYGDHFVTKVASKVAAELRIPANVSRSKSHRLGAFAGNRRKPPDFLLQALFFTSTVS